MPDTDLFLVGIRFSQVGKIYHFDASEIPDLVIGDPVIVETARGCQLGWVAQTLHSSEISSEGSWKKVDRRANPRDLIIRYTWQQKEGEVVNMCQNRVEELRLNNVKIVDADYSFDGSRLTITFSSESEEKVELKSLRQDMQRRFSPAQVELRQIGPRDVAKMIGGLGACGLEARCCCRFLTDFSSISIRMAKDQGISLTPAEITGICGRLRCCLIYEHEHYAACRARMPKKNKHVKTPQGEGKVIDVIPLRDEVIVELENVGQRIFKMEEISLIDPTAQNPSQANPNS